ncbi:GH43 family beta-xylosidase [Idiomarina loihiensis]|uniref:glycoside hydrolase family 43 protein n=1 Tax=Idiomarina TaxID=135575 RepID=UPI000D716707|nr:MULTISPECIES: glycoside hydrolase family 43 protein [Idiomarina]PWW34523.1 GH43 family beta-xylosidase [Idiomarina loihiensis]TDP47653.1 GH43 family beta-xylosidase [Idiomarina loihiensis]TDS23394.1 GH43 family beta-xylosidase [Idiomarina sp. H2]
MSILKPLIEQRADPFIYKHSDGFYYFTASVPAYDRIELRRAQTIEGLAAAETVSVWHKPDTGPYSELIWAPEIHFNEGAWYVYFAAAPSREIKDDLFQHRMYAIRCKDENPLTGEWEFLGQIDTGIDTFCLDATTFTHKGQLYYMWAQKEKDIPGNSNLLIATMENPWTLSSEPVRLTIPEFEWECRGFMVNEGPAVLQRNGKVFVTYSASATDENYAMGLLWADENADLMDPSSWHKSTKPVLVSEPKDDVFGPGHNSFTVAEDDESVLLVYHARTYTEIEGDPLWDPNRHTYVKHLRWDEDGMPVFGKASRDE